MAQISIADITAKFGISRSTIYRAVKKGRLQKLPNGNYDLAEVMACFPEYSSTIKTERPPVPEAVSNNQSDEIISLLKKQLAFLEHQIEIKDQQIDHLQKLLVAPDTRNDTKTSVTDTPDTKVQSTELNSNNIESVSPECFNNTKNDTLKRVTDTPDTQHKSDAPQQRATTKKPTLLGRLNRGLKAFIDS